MIFNWFAPACPLAPREKAWVEVRMRWLAEQFGIDRLVRAEVVRPTDTCFPDTYDGTPEAAQRYMDRLCGYMGVQPAFRLLVHDDEDLSGLAGWYEPGTLHVAQSLLGDAVALIARVVQGLAHHLLFSRKLLADEPDRAWVTDLLGVFLGVGVFLGNATLRQSCHHKGRSYSSFVYLSSPMLGYAMAIFAWLRGEEEPSWIGDLCPDASMFLRSGLRYLTSTGDCLLRPDNMRWGPSALPVGMLLDQLENGSPSERVAVLWELARRGLATPEVAVAVGQLLIDRRAGMRAEAARALAALAPAAETIVPELVATLDDGDDEVRTAAAYALGKLCVQAETVVPALVDHLEDDSDSAAAAAALALSRFGPAAAAALPNVLAALQGALMVNRYPAMDYLLHAVRAISPEPQAAIDALLESCDPDLRQQAPGMLSECRAVLASDDGPGAWFGRFNG
jgi:hypothetical protein